MTMPPNNPNVPYRQTGTTNSVFTIKKAGTVYANVAQAPFQHNPVNSNLGLPIFVNGMFQNATNMSNNGYWGLIAAYASINPFDNSAPNVNSSSKLVQSAFSCVNSFGIYDYTAILPNPGQYQTVATQWTSGYQGIYNYMTVTPNVLYWAPNNNTSSFNFYKNTCSILNFVNVTQNFRFAGQTTVSVGGNNVTSNASCSIIQDDGSVVALATAQYQPNTFINPGKSNGSFQVQNITRYGKVKNAWNPGTPTYSYYTNGCCFNPNYGNAVYCDGAGVFHINNILWDAGSLTGSENSWGTPAILSDPNDQSQLNYGYQPNYAVSCTPLGYFLLATGTSNGPVNYFLISPDLSYYFKIVYNGLSSAAQSAIGNRGCAYQGGGCGIDLNGNFWVYGSTGNTNFLPTLYSTLNQKVQVTLTGLPNINAPSLTCRDLWPCAQIIFEG